MIIPKWVKITFLILLVIFIITFFVVGWIFSGKVINVNLQKVLYDQTIQEVSDNNYTMKGALYTPIILPSLRIPPIIPLTLYALPFIV